MCRLRYLCRSERCYQFVFGLISITVSELWVTSLRRVSARVMATRSKRYGLRIGVARVRVALPARSPRVLSVFVKTCTVIRNSLEDRCDPRGVGASRGLRGAPARGSRRRRYPAGGVRDRQTLGSRHAGSDRSAPSSQAQQPSPAATPRQSGPHSPSRPLPLSPTAGPAPVPPPLGPALSRRLDFQRTVDGASTRSSSTRPAACSL